MTKTIRDWFNKPKRVSNSQKYYLVFMDTTPSVQFLERETLTEVYDIIINAQLVVGTYKIIKGEFLND